MSDARLLDVLEFLRTLRSKQQAQLLKRFREIAAFPTNHFDFIERDSTGRRVDVHMCGPFAIKYWVIKLTVT